MLTGEQLLGMLPASEPPPGFETRVMERIGLAAPGPRPRAQHHRRRPRVARQVFSPRVRRLLAAAAVVMAIIAAGAGGWILRGAGNPGAGDPGAGRPVTLSPLRHAVLVSADRQRAGQVFSYPGNPGWLYMSVDMNVATGTVICQVVGENGHVATVGAFWLTDGYGSWGSAEPAGIGPLAGARLVSQQGTVLATARFAQR
jgi:hypothetical protein